MRFKIILLSCLIFFILIQSDPIEAEAKIEFGCALSQNYPILKSSYIHLYPPPFQPGDYSSSATQTLYLKAQKSRGLSAVLNFLT